MEIVRVLDYKNDLQNFKSRYYLAILVNFSTSFYNISEIFRVINKLNVNFVYKEKENLYTCIYNQLCDI